MTNLDAGGEEKFTIYPPGGINSDFTLGLFGYFETDETFSKFLEAVVRHYDHSRKRLVVMLALLTGKTLLIADRMLSLRQQYDFRLELVIDRKQKWAYDNHTQSGVSEVRNRIIASADDVFIVDERHCEIVLLKMQQFFASNTDTTLYASYKEMDFACERLENFPHKSNLLSWGHQKRHKKLSLTPSVNFIHVRQFRVMADEIPDNLLQSWITNYKSIFLRHVRDKDQAAALLDLLSLKKSVLPITVFIYAFSFYNNLWSYGNSQWDSVELRFDQYQTLLQEIAAARKDGRPVRRINLFDFGRYDELFN